MSSIKNLCLGALLVSLLYGCSSTVQEKIELSQKSIEKAPSFKEDVFKIGFLLPLSGPHKKLGESLEKTAEWAYFRDLKNQGVSFVFEDSQGTSLGAQNALKNLIQQKVHLVIGPVFAQEAKAVQALARAKNIPVLSLSNDKNSGGSSVYVLGTSPADQMKQSLKFAAEQGVRTLVAFLPYSDYGNLLGQALPLVAKEVGIRLIDIKRYPSQNPYEYGTFETQGLDAIFVPEGTPNGKKILDSLHHQGVDLTALKIIGSSLWETMAPLPEGGFFAAPLQQERDQLLKELENYSGASMPNLTALLYDALYLAVSVKEAFYQNASLADALTQGQGFKGLEGAFRIKPQGYTEKLMALYQVHQGVLQKVQEAPLAFGS